MENVTGPDFHPDFIHAFNAYSPKGRNKSFLGIYLKLKLNWGLYNCEIAKFVE